MARQDKNKRIDFWVTLEEYESIKADQESMDYTNLSKYLRTLVLRKKIPIKKRPPMAPESSPRMVLK